MSEQEKIETAGRKKEDGNLLFKSGKYQRAGKKYDKVAPCLILSNCAYLASMPSKLKTCYLSFHYQAVDYISEDGCFGDGDHKVVKALRVSCWLNGAACCLKLNNFNGAIELCSKVREK